MNLQDLQTDFQNILLDAECAGADWIDDSAHDLSSRDRLAIYHNAYRVRLVDVLLDTFEHTSIYLGDEWFRQLATEYVQSHHSTQTNIGLYGQGFPEFLAVKLANDREIAELALLDWSLRRAFDGGDSDVLTQNDLQQLAGEAGGDMRLQPVPTLTVITQHFNTLDLWHAINTEQRPPEVERLQEPLDVLIWRKGHSPHFRSLSKLESASLAGVCSGRTLDEIGAALAQEFPDDDIATGFGLMLQRWLDDEIIAVR